MRPVEWVSLKEACTILGVHEATLRRWTDRGLLRAFRTPGGHRRYLRDDLLAFLAGSQAQPPAEWLARLADQTLSVTRQELSERLAQEAWAQRYAANRSAKQLSGRELLGLLIQYAARENNHETYLNQARAIMREYGREARGLGLSIPETARALLTFRQAIVDGITRSLYAPPGRDPDGQRLMNRAGLFFDELMIATLEGYLEPARPAASVPAGELHR